MGRLDLTQAAKLMDTSKLPFEPMDAKHGFQGAGPLVSAEEMHMLLTPGLGFYKASTPGRGFKYRNIFLLLCTLWFLSGLMFFPEVVYQFLTFPPSEEKFLSYLQNRGWLYLFWLLLYAWSYAKAWYFERVALVCFSSEVTMFAMDYLAVFSDIAGPMSPLMTFFFLLRLTFISCLLINALYAHDAPPAPQSLISA